MEQGRRGQRSGGARAQRLRARLRAPGALLLVAEQGGRVVGVLLAELVRGGPAPLEVGLLAGGPDAAGSLLAHLTARYPRVQAQPDAVADLAPYRAAGFAPVADRPQLLLRTGA